MVQCSEEKLTQVQGEGEILGQRKESGVYEACGAVRVIDAVRGLEGCSVGEVDLVLEDLA
jgi:hypothetical protein